MATETCDYSRGDNALMPEVQGLQREAATTKTAVRTVISTIQFRLINELSEARAENIPFKALLDLRAPASEAEQTTHQYPQSELTGEKGGMPCALTQTEPKQNEAKRFHERKAQGYHATLREQAEVYVKASTTTDLALPVLNTRASAHENQTQVVLTKEHFTHLHNEWTGDARAREETVDTRIRQLRDEFTVLLAAGLPGPPSVPPIGFAVAGEVAQPSHPHAPHRAQRVVIHSHAHDHTHDVVANSACSTHGVFGPNVALQQLGQSGALPSVPLIHQASQQGGSVPPPALSSNRSMNWVGGAVCPPSHIPSIPALGGYAPEGEDRFRCWEQGNEAPGNGEEDWACKAIALPSTFARSVTFATIPEYVAIPWNGLGRKLCSKTRSEIVSTLSHKRTRIASGLTLRRAVARALSLQKELFPDISSDGPSPHATSIEGPAVVAFGPLRRLTGTNSGRDLIAPTAARAFAYGRPFSTDPIPNCLGDDRLPAINAEPVVDGSDIAHVEELADAVPSHSADAARAAQPAPNHPLDPRPAGYAAGGLVFHPLNPFQLVQSVVFHEHVHGTFVGVG